MPAEQLQLERFKLQEREYRYYYAANRDRLPAIPDLTDQSGGLSNRAYFNFVSYVLLKVVARHTSDPELRTGLCTRVGRRLLEGLQPAARPALAAAAAASGSGRAPPGDVLAALQSLLERLESGGYVCGWQLVWGELPGSWPADWADTQPRVVVAEAPGGSGGAGAEVLQIKLAAPADIEGSVALRAEDDGFWGRYVSSMVGALLAAGGYQAATADEYFSQDSWSGPTGGLGALLLLLGDPLQQVDVPWTPTTLVQDWQLA